jgi:Basic region leucine zipper
MDLPGPPSRPPEEDASGKTGTASRNKEAGHDPYLDDDDNEYESSMYAGNKRKSSSPDDDPDRNIPTKELTEAQKIERRERNREHAKRSRLRKKFLLDSLQEQIHGLEEQLDGLKSAIKLELPAKAEEIIRGVCGDKQKFTPLPMPSGFGPVKTLMEPDFRLSKWCESVLA